ncbi:L,D-transpeptidase [Candidatus Falkowbacteria bacterium]|nr:L,D-transpeptidase [Candidatus Falkowbacteria bacterium]
MKRIALLIVFVCFFISPAKAEEMTRRYYIEISIGARELYLYESATDGSYMPVRTYDVAVPKKGIKEYPRGEGKITGIEFRPAWYPTKNTRESYLKKKKIVLPDIIFPGSPLNAMGAAKIYLSHCTSYGCAYRIHGTNDEKSIGKAVSRGCFRMRNKEIEELARLLKGREVKVDIIF